MMKRILTLVMSVMVVSVLSVMIVSAGEKAVSGGLLRQGKEAAEDTADETEKGTDDAASAEQIAENLTAHAWEADLEDEHYYIEFGDDKYVRYTITDAQGEWYGQGMASYRVDGNKITIDWEDDPTAEYDEESAASGLVFKNALGMKSFSLVPAAE